MTVTDEEPAVTPPLSRPPAVHRRCDPPTHAQRETPHGSTILTTSGLGSPASAYLAQVSADPGYLLAKFLEVVRQFIRVGPTTTRSAVGFCQRVARRRIARRRIGIAVMVSWAVSAPATHQEPLFSPHRLSVCMPGAAIANRAEWPENGLFEPDLATTAPALIPLTHLHGCIFP